MLKQRIPPSTFDKSHVFREGRNMKLLICDDDRPFAEDLRLRILDHFKGPSWKISIDCISDIERLAKIDAAKYDVAFLDIDMGKINGISLARRMRKQHSNLILVFITNYVQYSLDGYEVHALRYLLKSQLDEKLLPCLNAVMVAYRKDRNLVRFSSNNIEIDILPSHMVFAETKERRLKIHLINEARSSLMVSMTMSKLEELLAPRGFLRIHQSFLVNMAYIQQIKSNGIWLKDGTRLPISARNYQELKQEYLRWKGMKRWNT